MIFQPARPDQVKSKPHDVFTVSNRPKGNPLFGLSMAPDGEAQKADKLMQRPDATSFSVGDHESRKAGNWKWSHVMRPRQNTMDYRKLLTLALVPSVLFLLLSLVSVALTTHYWIIGDWITPRGVRVVTDDFNERTQSYTIDETIVYFTENDTDATIVSGCLCLTAGVIAVIAWAELRKPGMDTLQAANKRRFWILAVVVTSLVGAVTALVSIILHYTNMGDDAFGCRSETLQMAGRFNTNKYCTREMAACNFLPEYLSKGDKDSAALGCAEAVTVKWLQIAMILLALVILSIYSMQAWLRRKTRPARMIAVEKEPMPLDSSDHFSSSERFPSRERF
ncbi:hypothetical protein SVAN01_06336 [Stagonosporopsis vannaccii]|nr:hypothetical protein SVAN01_06336 [Stagonosporopsis vannaccii]